MKTAKKYQMGAGVFEDALNRLPSGLADVLRRFCPGKGLDRINRSSTMVIPPKRGYRWHPGFIAWFLHRLTGAALAGYLILHLYVLSSLAQGPEAFDRLMAGFDSPLIKLLEICLLGVVVYHTINGLRIVFMDYGPLAKKEIFTKAVWVTLAVFGGITIIGGLVMLVHIVA